MEAVVKGSLCALLLLSSLAQAADTTNSYPELLLDDIRFVLTEPARWQSPEWKNAAWAGIAVVATAAFIDAPLRDEMRRLPKDNKFMLNIERFGAEYSVGVVAGFYLVGSLADNEQALCCGGLTYSQHYCQRPDFTCDQNCNGPQSPL